MYFDQEETLSIQVKDKPVGLCGKIDQSVVEAFEINKPVYAFVLDLSVLMPLINVNRFFKPITKFPYIEKDMALVLDKSKSAGDVIGAIKKAGGILLKTVEIFDIFEGGNLPDDKKSIAIRMRFQSEERTLNDVEIDKIFRDIISLTTKSFNATLRY